MHPQPQSSVAAAFQSSLQCQRHVRLPVDCLVCGRPSLYNYYSARCCESCKQFFRRSVVKQLEYACKKGGECRIKKGERCSSCRIDRCLLAGMDPLLVNSPDANNFNNFLAKLAERRERAKERCSENNSCQKQEWSEDRVMMESMLNEQLQISAAGDLQLVESLLYLEAKHQHIWNACTELPTDYLGRFDSLEDLIRYPGNILAKSDQFLLENIAGYWDREDYVHRSDKFGIALAENCTFLCVDRLLLVEMAKALPFFRRLEPRDQVLLLRHISGPIGIFCNSFYSAALGADTWMRANGVTFICAYQSKRFRHNSIIHNLGRQNLCKSVEMVKAVGLCRVEFALMLVILYCRSTASDLSELAKELLYTESVRYSRVLLSVLQQKHGHLAGAAKYAQRMHLMESMVMLEKLMHILITHIDLTALNGPKNHREELEIPASIPKILLQLL